MRVSASALWTTFILCIVRTNAQVKAMAGEDVLLQCQAPRGAAIGLIEWTKTDLKSGDYVFFYREGKSYNNFQHPSFRGRVKLVDPQMDGDISVILQNVTINDTGTYECWTTIINPGGSGQPVPQLINATNLTVTDSGQTPGKDGGNTCERYLFIVPVMLWLLFLCC